MHLKSFFVPAFSISLVDQEGAVQDFILEILIWRYVAEKPAEKLLSGNCKSMGFILRMNADFKPE